MKMKKTILFNKLLNFLFYLSLVIVLSISISFFAIPCLVEIDPARIRILNQDVISVHLIPYTFVVIIICFYIIRALFYLKKVSYLLLKKHHFSDDIIINLKKTGKNFLISGIISGSFEILFFLYTMLEYRFQGFKIPPSIYMILFLLIIGLFFIIQSESLAKAKELEEENKLTI